MLNNGKKIRLIDIAEQVGVTPAVVSLVLNHRQSPRQHVSIEKREAILRIAHELNYQPDISARALTGKQTGMIGVLVDTEAPTPSFDLVAALEAQANSRNMHILIGEAHDNVQHFFEIYQRLRQHKVDGIICISHDYPGLNHEVERYFANAPNTVFIGFPLITGCAHVIPALEAGMQDAIHLLRQKGRTRIAHIALAGILNQDCLRRTQIYLEECNGDDAFLTYCDYSYGKHQAFAAEVKRIVHEFILPRKVDAIVAVSDMMAFILYEQLRAVGVRIPEDIAIVGFDNREIDHYTNPSLSSIDLNMPVIASHALSIIDQFTAGKTPSLAPIYVPSKLIVRDSI